MTLEAKVERAMELWPETRNDDRKLELAVWYIEGLVLSETQKRMFRDKCSPAESITRARRKIQAQGELQADEEIREHRSRKEVQARMSFGRSVFDS